MAEEEQRKMYSEKRRKQCVQAGIREGSLTDSINQGDQDAAPIFPGILLLEASIVDIIFDGDSMSKLIRSLKRLVSLFNSLRLEKETEPGDEVAPEAVHGCSSKYNDLS